MFTTKNPVTGRKRRTLLLGVAAGALAIAALGLGRHELFAAWYRSQLRRDPSKLEQFCRAPNDSAKRRAASEFLASDTGKERLLYLYIESLEHPTLSLHDRLTDWSSGKLAVKFGLAMTDVVLVEEIPGGGSATVHHDPDGIRRLEELLGILVGETVLLPEFPDLEFRIQKKYGYAQEAHRAALRESPSVEPPRNPTIVLARKRSGA